MRAALVRLIAFLPVADVAGCGYIGYESPTPDTIEDATVDTSTVEAGADGGGSSGPTLADVCRYESITVLLDDDANDNQAGGQLASAVAAGCGTTPSVQSLHQSTPGLLDSNTSAPLYGTTTLGVAGGGYISQRLAGYLLTTGAPLDSVQTDTDWIITSRLSGQVISTPRSMLGATRDVFVVEVARDPVSGAFALLGYGYDFRGTLAAGQFAMNVLTATLPNDTRQYYVVDWTDTDGQPDPSSGDTYTVLATGP